MEIETAIKLVDFGPQVFATRGELTVLVASVAQGKTRRLLPPHHLLHSSLPEKIFVRSERHPQIQLKALVLVPPLQVAGTARLCQSFISS